MGQPGIVDDSQNNASNETGIIPAYSRDMGLGDETGMIKASKNGSFSQHWKYDGIFTSQKKSDDHWL